RKPGRREFLRRSTAIAASLAALEVPRTVTAAAPAEDAGLVDSSDSPHVTIRGVGLGDVRWTRGFWADRFETCRSVMVPNLWKVMGGKEPSQFYQNFKIAAGLADGTHRGPPWNDGDFYKWLEAAAAMYALTKDEALDRRMDAIIEVIARAQR